jgi:hypothetical protein
LDHPQPFTDPRDPLEAGNPDGKKLYATLLQPVEKLIPANSRVVILPDGSHGLQYGHSGVGEWNGMFLVPLRK